MGGLTGRAWERVLECNVLHFEQRALQMLAQGLGNSIADEAKGMHELVAKSVGSKHWTTSRLAEIVDGVRLQGNVSAVQCSNEKSGDSHTMFSVTLQLCL